MQTISYLIPVTSGIFDYAMQEASEEDFRFFGDFLVGKKLSEYSAILTTTDNKHYQLTELGRNFDILSDLAIEVATHAIDEVVINCTGKDADELKQIISRERRFNNAMQGIGRFCDLMFQIEPSDELTQVKYEST